MIEYTFELDEKEVMPMVNYLNEYRRKHTWPQVGDMYYYVDGDTVEEEKYSNNLIDNGYKAVGNFFKTPEEAEFKLEQIKVMHELEELADDDQPWDFVHSHYELCYDFDKKDICSSSLCVTKSSLFYFKSLKSAEAAIEKIGKDRLKKYYFCVEEGN